VKTSLLVLGIGILAVAAEPVRADPAADDLKQLEGTWKVSSAEVAGKPVKEFMAGPLEFKDGKLLGFNATVKLDPTQKPKAITLVLDNREWLGIYDLQGDDLKLSLALVEPGKLKDQKRPTDFDGKSEKPQIVLTCKRQK
jgi:uncharacterized protein (TIGR03067 family)